jgi:hypothetical protein
MNDSPFARPAGSYSVKTERVSKHSAEWTVSFSPDGREYHSKMRTVARDLQRLE